MKCHGPMSAADKRQAEYVKSLTPILHNIVRTIPAALAAVENPKWWQFWK